jgi:hypothetical protein
MTAVVATDAGKAITASELLTCLGHLNAALKEWRYLGE